MVYVLHTLTCERCDFVEESCNDEFNIDDVLEFTRLCEKCESSDSCENCIKMCEKCNDNFCDDCIEDHTKECTYLINEGIEQ
jgi:hypothetical protein